MCCSGARAEHSLSAGPVNMSRVAVCVGFCWGLVYIPVVAEVGQLRTSSMVYIQHLIFCINNCSDNPCSCSGESNLLLLMPMALYLLVRMCPLLTEQICFILFFRSFECSEMKWLFFFKGQWLQLGASWMFLLTGMNQRHMWGADSVFYFISFSHLSESERERVSNWFSVEMWC